MKRSIISKMKKKHVFKKYIKFSQKFQIKTMLKQNDFAIDIYKKSEYFFAFKRVFLIQQQIVQNFINITKKLKLTKILYKK